MATSADKKTVIVFGATGSVGKAMLGLIIKDKLLGDVKVGCVLCACVGGLSERVWRACVCV